MLNKIVNFFKSKSIVDIVYLVMMILIVTMIKDMVVSMYKKRKDKQWLDKAFGKGKFNGKREKGKIVEGFSGELISCSVGNATICERLKYLLCDNNMAILKKYIDADIGGEDNFDAYRRLLGILVEDSDGNMEIRCSTLKTDNLDSMTNNTIKSHANIDIINNKELHFHGLDESDSSIHYGTFKPGTGIGDLRFTGSYFGIDDSILGVHYIQNNRSDLDYLEFRKFDGWVIAWIRPWTTDGAHSRFQTIDSSQTQTNTFT